MQGLAGAASLFLDCNINMGSTSITAFSFYSQSQTKFLNSKTICYFLRNSIPRIHHPDKHLRISFQPATAGTTLLPALTCSHIPCTPTSSSKFSSPTCAISPQRSLTKYLVEKLLFLIIGLFIFMGCFNKKAALALPPVSSGGVLEEKMESVTEKRDEEEEEMCEQILKKDPKNVEALKVILYRKIRRGKSKEAIKFVERLIEVEPDEVEWRLLLALCYETMGQLSAAKRLFREILKKRPLLVRALHGLAMVMHKNHEGPAVFDMLNKARELACRKKRVTEERNIRILIAQMLVVQGALEEGLRRFQNLVEENPRDFRPYLCQGIIYSLLDKKEEAAQQFETYKALVPEEFPQRGFLDDVALTAKGTSREQLQKEFEAQVSDKN